MLDGIQVDPLRQTVKVEEQQHNLSALQLRVQ